MTLEDKYTIEFGKIVGKNHGALQSYEKTQELLKNFRKEVEQEILCNWDKEVYYTASYNGVEYSMIYYNKYKKIVSIEKTHSTGRHKAAEEQAIKQGLKIL